MGYAVIYDSWNETLEDWQDDMYEHFSTPEEAVKMFTQAYGDIPRKVLNPRLVEIIEPIPGNWSTYS